MKKIDEELKNQIGQLFMFGYKEENKKEFLSFIKEKNIGFVDLFSRNFKGKNNLKDVIEEIHKATDNPPLTFTDQEGGTVVQFGEKVATSTSAMGLGATGDPELAYLSGKIIGRDLSLIGIDVDIAPVVDVNSEIKNPIIGIRAFSDEPETVSSYALKFVEGLKSSGVYATLKHFPGHGGTKEDSHLTLPRVKASLWTIKKRELYPYFKLSNKTEFIMTAHIVFESIDETPTTFSEFFMKKLLRDEIGFQGVLISDCLEMSAIISNFSLEEIVEKAFNAGVDVLLFSHTLELQKEAIETTLKLIEKGKISVEQIKTSLERVKRAKEKVKKIKKKFEGKLRAFYDDEVKISERSITVLKWNRRKPISSNETIGIIEFEKLPSTVQIHESIKKSYLEDVLKERHKSFELLLLPLKKPEKRLIENFLKKHKTILVAVYSRREDSKKIQGEAVREILGIKKDSIVVSLGNPFDIEEFPHVLNHIVTYSFRKAQIEALFDILEGKVKPSGKLPVNINSQFKRGYGIENIY